MAMTNGGGGGGEGRLHLEQQWGAEDRGREESQFEKREKGCEGRVEDGECTTWTEEQKSEGGMQVEGKDRTRRRGEETKSMSNTEVCV